MRRYVPPKGPRLNVATKLWMTTKMWEELRVVAAEKEWSVPQTIRYIIRKFLEEVHGTQSI